MKNQKVDTQYPNIEENQEEKQNLAMHPPVQKTFPKENTKKKMKTALKSAKYTHSDRGSEGRG